MDRMYLKNVLELLEREKLAHDSKFAGIEVHAHCLPNFDRAIAKIMEELNKLDEVAHPQISDKSGNI
jgi:hypothetical protein